MSQTETHIGKLRKIECDSQNGYAASIMQKIGEMPSVYDSPLEWLLSENSEKYFSTKCGLYEAIEHKKLDSDDDINDLKENGGWDYKFYIKVL